MKPELVVQKQLDAYNARDIDAFMATYAEDAQFFQHPSTLLANGAAEIRQRMIERFKEPNLHAELLKRIVLGNIVMDQDRNSNVPGRARAIDRRGYIRSRW